MAKVLLVEDDVFLNKVYAKYLEKAGHAAECLFDGVDVIEKVVEYKPDLVIVDLIMPKRDGFSVIEDLKADEVTKSIPIIVLTVLRTDEDKEKAKKLGASDYFVKSKLSIQEMVDKVKENL